MHSVEVFYWRLPADPEHGRPKPSRTRWKMTREQALRDFPGAVCERWSRELRQLPDGPDEYELTSGRRGC